MGCRPSKETVYATGQTLPAQDPGAFLNAMEMAFYGPLGKLTVPSKQRHFATKDQLPKYGSQIAALKAKGAKLISVFGIGRACLIALWDPHFAAEFHFVVQWVAQECRLGVVLRPMTIEQNAITSFKIRTTLVPTRANTIGPGLFLQSTKKVGGADGALGRGMMLQGLSFWATLHHPPMACFWTVGVQDVVFFGKN